MKLLTSILFIILLCLCVSGYVEALEIPESLLISIIELEGGEEFLNIVLAQIEQDQLEIDQLRLQRDTFEQEVWDCKQEIKYLENELRHTKGLHIGAGGGINFNKKANIEIIFLYKYRKSAVYLSGGYPSVTLGYLHKINTRR